MGKAITNKRSAESTRPPSKLAFERQVLGAHGAEDWSVYEDLSIGVTTQLPTEVEFRKKSTATNPELTGYKSIKSSSEKLELTEKQKQISKKLLSILDELKESFQTYERECGNKTLEEQEEYKKGETKFLEEFLKNKKDEDLKVVLNFPNENGMTILHDVANLYEWITELLLSAGANPNVQDTKGKTPLHYAADFNCTGSVAALLNTSKQDEVKALLKEGVELDKVKALLNASKQDEIKALLKEGAGLDEVEALLNACAKPNIQDKDGCTPLHSAVNSNACDSALAIIEAGADLDVPDGNGQTPLLIAAICDREDTAKRLLEKGAKYNIPDNEGNTAIYYAVKQGLIGIVECLMEKDDIDLDTLHVYESMPEHGALKESPLHSAVALSIKSGRIAELLLRKESIDVNIDDERGNTPLLIAAGSGRNSTVDLLIEKGADVHSVNSRENNVFHFAAANDYIDKFSMPSSSGKSKNDIASVGWLYDAEQAKNSKSVVDLNPCMIINTIIEQIRQEERKKGSNDNKIIQKVLKSINARNKDGNTPLFFAIERGNHDVIKKLLEEGAKIIVTDEKGAKVVVTDQNGYTPFHYAVKNKDSEILKLLSITPLERGEIMNHIQFALMKNTSQEFSNMDDFVKQYKCLDIASRITETVLPSISYNDNNEESISKKIENMFPAYMKEDKKSYEAIRKYVSKVIESAVNTTKIRLNVLDKEGNTLLHHAVKWGCGEKALEFLVRSGVDINTKNKHGVAPIHIAAKYGEPSQIEFFIKNKADLNVQCGKLSRSAVDNIGKEKGLSGDAYINVQDGNVDASTVDIKDNVEHKKAPAISIAAEGGHGSAVNTFLLAGAKPSIADSRSWLPLHIAIKRASEEGCTEKERKQRLEIVRSLASVSYVESLMSEGINKKSEVWKNQFFKKIKNSLTDALEVTDNKEVQKEVAKAFHNLMLQVTRNPEEINKILQDSIKTRNGEKSPGAPISEEASAPVFDDGFYHGMHIEEVPDLYLDPSYKIKELASDDYGVNKWYLQGDNSELQRQREVAAREIENGWEDGSDDIEKKDVDDSTSGWSNASKPKAWDSLLDGTFDNQQEIALQLEQSNDIKTKPDEKPISAKQKEEPETDKKPSTTLSDASAQEVSVEKRSHLERTKHNQVKLNEFLNKISKAQNMAQLDKIVDEALKAGVRINCAQGNKDTFTNVVLSKASQLKVDPKIASGVVCKLVSKGAIFGQNFNKMNDELEKLFKDHRTDIQKASSKFNKLINEFQRVVGSAISQGKLNKLEIDNTTFYLEYSQDSVLDVAKIIDGAKSLGLNQGDIACGGNIVKIGESEVEIETKNGIRNYTDLSDNGDVILTFPTSFGELEVRLRSDAQNKDIIRVDVSDNDRKILDQLEDTEEIGKNCLLGNNLSVCDAIKQGYFKRSGSGKLQTSETISLPGKVMKEASEIVKILNSGDITVNSSVNDVQLSKVAPELGRRSRVTQHG